MKTDSQLARAALTRPSTIAWALVALAGAAFIAWLLPVAMLDPRSIEWVLEGNDQTTAWLGWQYFRREAWLWPPGLVAGYGMEMGSSIVFTDSIPFVALALKPFDAWLPPSFQYFGLWAVACGALAAAFAYRALHEATRHQAAALAGALFAASSVFMTARFIGHFALAGHWLIWWALSIYFSDESRRNWLERAACLIIAAGVHAYLFVLVSAVVAADVARRWMQSREPVRSQIVGWAVSVAGLTAAAFWVYGYFVLESVRGDPRIYGTYGLPLNALAWRSNPSLEGGAYIGAGALAAVAITMALSAWYWRDTMRVLRSHVFLLIATVGVTAVAITHRIYWGDALVAEIPLPSTLLARLAVFRGSGRFGWLLAYLAMFISLATIAARLPRRASCVLIALLALLQLADVAPHYGRLRQHFEASVSSPQTYKRLADARWPQLVAGHSMVLVAPMEHAAPYWRELGLLASAQGKPINVGQFARAHWPSFAPAYDRILMELREGSLREDALYVITRPERVVLSDRLSRSCSLMLDGLQVIAVSLCRDAAAAR